MQNRPCLVLVLVLAAACLLPGCGGSEPAAGEGGPGGQAAGGKAAAGVPLGAQPVIRTIGGKQWIGEVPRDIYFEDPLSVAADKQAVGAAGGDAVAGSPMSDPAGGKGVGEASESDPLPATASEGDWKSVIGIEPLKTEVKAIRNSLTGHLQNVGKFNSGIKEIPSDGATLAVLASVAAAHSGEVSWKKKAKFIRDLAGQMLTEKLARGRKSFDQVKNPFETIVEILDGGSPAELPESKDQAAFSDVAEFGYLMQRMDKGFKWIQGNARDEESYKEHAAKVRHEAAVMGVLARVIKEEGYGWLDDEDFVKHADAMLDACLSVEKAVAAEAFADYDKAITKIDQLCTQCHMGRR